MTWALAVLGAFVTAAPRMFPPLAKGDEGFEIPADVAPGVILGGAVAVVAGAALKELDAHFVKKRSLSVLQSAAQTISDLHRELPRMMGSDYSVHRRDAVVKAAQQCAVDLLRDSVRGRIRATFYQIDFADVEQPEGATPGQRRNEDARLVRVGAPYGRGVADEARMEFRYDDRGRDTIDKILGKKTIVCKNARREAKHRGWPKPSYGSYLSVPIIVEGEVEGMLSCDSLETSALRHSMRDLMSIPATFAGVELRALRNTSFPAKPDVRS